MRIRPRNWTTFQHYKDRAPPWIKLHHALLDDFEFQNLPVQARALAPMLWLIASERQDAAIDASDGRLAFRLRMSAAELEEALPPLIEGDFFEVLHDASNTLPAAICAASPETEKEEETEAEAEERQNARSADADEIALAVEAYNCVAKELGWPIAQTLTEIRRKKLVGRLRECGGLEGWRMAMEKARVSRFLKGETGRDRVHANWTPGFDFFLQQSSFTKLMEGHYDDRDCRAEPDGFAAVVAGARAAAH